MSDDWRTVDQIECAFCGDHIEQDDIAWYAARPYHQGCRTAKLIGRTPTMSLDTPVPPLDAYDRWREKQSALPESERQHHICETLGDDCADWVCDHIRAYARGEYVGYSWRHLLRQLFATIRRG